KDFPDALSFVMDFPPASREILITVHNEKYINNIEASLPKDDNPGIQTCHLFDSPEHVTQYMETEDLRGTQDFDTFMSQNSLEAALLAAGAVCVAVDMVRNIRPSPQTNIRLFLESIAMHSVMSVPLVMNFYLLKLNFPRPPL